MPVFTIDICDSTDARLGSGPITTATAVAAYTTSVGGGRDEFDMPAADPQGALVESDSIRIARCYSLRANARTEFGAGILRQRGLRGATDSTRSPSGQDLLGELLHRQVGAARLLSNGAGGPTTIAAALTTIIGLAPSGWTVDTTTYRSTGTTTNASPTVTSVTNISNFVVGGTIAGTGIPAGTTVSNISGTTITLSANATATASGVALSASLYLELNNETVLAALTKIADQAGDQFRADGRVIVWLYKQQPSSGMVAILDGDPLALASNTGVCLVDGDPEETKDMAGMATRIYPYGAGNGDARLTLAGTTWTAPPGYTLNTTDNYIRYDAAEASPSDQVDVVKTYNDIGATAGGTAVHGVSAANQLAAKAFAELQQIVTPVYTYRLRVMKLDGALDVGQTLRFIWRKYVDGFWVVKVDATLVVMEMQTSIDTEERTASLTVATVPRWPRSDLARGTGVRSALQATSSHPQTASSALRLTGTGGAAAAAIHARYTTAAGQSISSSTGVTIVDFDTLVDDTNTAVITGGSWHFTAPIAGRYLVIACVDFVTTTTWALNERAILDVFVNGSVYSQLRRMSNLDSSGTTAIVGLMGSDTVVLAAGDTLDIRVSQNSGAALALSASALANRVSIALL
jgi:hypothetical protein